MASKPGERRLVSYATDLGLLVEASKNNQPQHVTEAMNASGARYFNLAFVLDSGGCTPAWNGDPAHRVSTDTTVAGVVDAVRAAGGIHERLRAQPLHEPAELTRGHLPLAKVDEVDLEAALLEEP